MIRHLLIVLFVTKCLLVAPRFGELGRDILYIGLHIYIFNEPLRQR